MENNGLVDAVITIRLFIESAIAVSSNFRDRDLGRPVRSLREGELGNRAATIEHDDQLTDAINIDVSGA